MISLLDLGLSINIGDIDSLLEFEALINFA